MWRRWRRGGTQRPAQSPRRVFVCASCLCPATGPPSPPSRIMKGKSASKKVEPVTVMDNLNGLSPLVNRCRR